MKLTFKVIGVVYLSVMAAAAKAQMPKVELTIHVIDENGKPVQGAEIGASFPHLYGAGASYQGEEKQGMTDVTGRVSWRSQTGGKVGFAATKQGYYRSQGEEVDFMQMVRDGKEARAERQLVLKSILKPVPMYARWFEASLPETNKPFGFDLMEGDWVAPWGHGKTVDLIFTVIGSYAKFNDYDATLQISFPNKGDGLVRFEGQARTGSKFRSEHQAPADGYEEKLTLHKSRKPNQDNSLWTDDSASRANYYLRVRTILDENGKIVSAHYGKVYGNFQFGAAENHPIIIKAEISYINPSPNDRNVEFDLKRNLARLQESDRINLP